MLNSLFINGDKFRPTIDFSPEKDALSISGKILVENSKDFFNPLHNWMNDYCKVMTKNTTLIIDLVYYNTSAFKELLSLMYTISQSKKPLTILWKYDRDDDVSLEDAEELQDILGKDCFTYIEKS